MKPKLPKRAFRRFFIAKQSKETGTCFSKEGKNVLGVALMQAKLFHGPGLQVVGWFFDGCCLFSWIQIDLQKLRLLGASCFHDDTI